MLEVVPLPWLLTLPLYLLFFLFSLQISPAYSFPSTFSVCVTYFQNYISYLHLSPKLQNHFYSWKFSNLLAKIELIISLTIHPKSVLRFFGNWEMKNLLLNQALGSFFSCLWAVAYFSLCFCFQVDWGEVRHHYHHHNSCLYHHVLHHHHCHHHHVHHPHPHHHCHHHHTTTITTITINTITLPLPSPPPSTLRQFLQHPG